MGESEEDGSENGKRWKMKWVEKRERALLSIP